MANSIELFNKYIDLLDEVYAGASCTAVLDGDPTLARAGANANEITIPMISMDGLANYSRNSGYVGGDVSMSYETVQFNYDRGRKFSVDNMDNEETVGLSFGKLAAEFIRTKTVPELDAFRFATYAAADGISVVSTPATLTTGTDVLTAIAAAQDAMDEDEVSSEERYLFITPTLLRSAKTVDTNKRRDVLDDFAGIIKVPQKRFYTSIDMYDGISEGEKVGGYKKGTDHYEQLIAQPADWSANYKSYYTESDGIYSAVTGDSAPEWSAATYYKKTASAAKDINFMIIQKSAVIQYPKHKVNKVIRPEDNQSSDSWMFFFRAYGLADTYENKRAGIYLHHKA